jgi:D-beta-D-heptose 7-phosphate kinase / D-beta-D-heptose 1-phosphate adenosyltransferase
MPGLPAVVAPNHTHGDWSTNDPLQHCCKQRYRHRRLRGGRHVNRSTNRKVLVIGDILLDTDIEGDVRRFCPDTPAPVVDVTQMHERAGGAGLAATLLDRPDIDVTLATGLAGDESSKRLTDLLANRFTTASVVTTPRTRCKTRVRGSGQTLLRLDCDPPSTDVRDLPCDTSLLAELIADADAALVSDYAGGVASHPEVRSLLSRWRHRVPIVWDPHPRGQPPLAGVTVATPNRSEAMHFHGSDSDSVELDQVAAVLRDRWKCDVVAVTDGANGVFTAGPHNASVFTPVPRRCSGDSCGAGDRFAGTLAAELAGGVDAITGIRTAVVDTARWLSAGGVGTSSADLLAVQTNDAAALVERTRMAGGVVVATGGCFDVLHAGHVASLEAASQLGDLLVVLVNSDESVRRLKGSGRPVHSVEDRCRVLKSLRCVDAVEVFDGLSPSESLRRLRPDIWVKGGDYAASSMPETPLVTSWGGRVVLLPILNGRSTTRILNHQEGGF